MTDTNALKRPDIDFQEWKSQVMCILDRLAQRREFSDEVIEDFRGPITGFFKSIDGLPRVANAGLFNAGKSTLFNALCEEQELFATSAARKTTEQQYQQVRHLELVDTPGLDSNQQDTDEAFDAYRKSHVILFIHSAINGELDRQEMDYLKNLRALFEDADIRQTSIIPVLTKCENVESELEKIVDAVRDQWSQTMGVEPDRLFEVRAETHLKGLAEDEPLLCEHSRIPALRDRIEETIDELAYHRQALVQRRINDAIDSLVAMLDARIQNHEQRRQQRQAEANQKIRDMRDDFDGFRRSHRDAYQSIAV